MSIRELVFFPCLTAKMVCLIARWSLGEDVSFCNVKTKMMMRNSSAALSFKLKTTVSSVGRGNQEAVAGDNVTARVGEVESLVERKIKQDG